MNSMDAGEKNEINDPHLMVWHEGINKTKIV